MYKAMMKNQNSFFSSADDALSFFTGRMELSVNMFGLPFLKMDGQFLASLKESEKEDAILFYANRQIELDNRKASR
jgi:hypothetical protein